MQSTQLHETAGLRTFGLVFDTDDEVEDLVLGFAEDHDVTGATLSGIGAFRHAVLGYFDWQRKDYLDIPVDEQVEVLSLNGNLARTGGGQVKLHAHVVVGKRDGTVRGGHFLSGVVRPTLEIVVTETPAHLTRRHDEETGLPLLDLDG